MSGQVSDDGRRGRAVEPRSEVDPAPLGAALRGAREAQGLTVADVARSINLRETVVSAIEADDFTLCGGDVYARGHIRAYARRLGLDAGPLVESYDQRTGAPPEGARVALLSDHDVPLERGRPNWPLLAGVALVAVVALLGWQLVSELRGPARPVERVVTAGASTATASASPTAPADSTPATGQPTGPTTGPTTTGPTTTGPTTTGPTTGPTATPRSDRVAVALTITGDSWVEVRDARGRTMWKGLMAKGDSKRFTNDAALRLTLGNAGGVELTVNGTPLGTAGRAGEVKRLTFRPGEVARLS